MPDRSIESKVDSMMHAEMVSRAESVGGKKARLDLTGMFIFAVLVGPFIEMGAIFSIRVGSGGIKLKEIAKNAAETAKVARSPSPSPTGPAPPSPTSAPNDPRQSIGQRGSPDPEHPVTARPRQASYLPNPI
jgi:hypothetical protein